MMEATDRPRSLPGEAPADSFLALPQPHLFSSSRPVLTFLHTLLVLISSQLNPTVKMVPMPEADPDEPQETKPFKFVTGEFPFGLFCSVCTQLLTESAGMLNIGITLCP